MKIQIINGDNIEVLKQMPDNSIDSVVTDPPYGLGKEPDALELMKDWIDNGYHEIKGGGFMGKEWDAFVPQPKFWKEVFRVLKHGGHVLAFYGTRTYDWGVMAMRFAGFEVRDTIYWHYGSGFPKSHNIGKAIDKKGGNPNLTTDLARDLKKARESRGISKTKADEMFCGGTTLYSWYEGRKDGIQLPTSIYMRKIADAFPELEKYVGLSMEAEREVIGTMSKARSFKSGYALPTMGGNIVYKDIDITAPSTDAAKEWDGWGSALKPASEPIVMARKPLEKGLSIAENVLKYGTGGINIDGCRVGIEQRSFNSKGIRSGFGNYVGDTNFEGQGEVEVNGRFPANLIMTHHPECECKGTKKVKPSNGSGRASDKGGGFSKGMFGDGTSDNIGGSFVDENGEETIEDWDCHEDCPIRIMDEQSGESKSTGGNSGVLSNSIYGKFATQKNNEGTGFGDKGGASRFFYCAKASKNERNKGLDKEKWFNNLELVFNNCSFTEQNLFIWEQGELNQNTDLNGEAQQKKDISEGIVLLVEDKECYTTLCGKEKEVLFPKAIKFTTSTGLNQIIELKTLNYYQHLNINDCIADVIETNKENGLSLAENVGMKNLLMKIFTKDEMGFLRGVKIVAKKTPQIINVKDVWQKTNIHSTVKPVKLMQYLVRLVTPPNGKVLDPFCGSGTTGIACKLEGFEFVGIEQDPEYTKIAEARIKNWIEDKDQKDQKKEVDKKGFIQQDLF